MKYLILHKMLKGSESLPGWGEWVEIPYHICNSLAIWRLSPDGESGLKSISAYSSAVYYTSLPGWGEWVEILLILLLLFRNRRLSPDGESGLKYHNPPSAARGRYVSPRMGRGG